MRSVDKRNFLRYSIYLDKTKNPIINVQILRDIIDKSKSKSGITNAETLLAKIIEGLTASQ